MKGFTGQYHNGHPVFIRNDYEEAHANESELERIADLTGVYYDTMSFAIERLKLKDESLVYRKYDESLDEYLRKGRWPEDLWERTNYGWVHSITGELITELKPDFDSFPCWCIQKPYSFEGITLLKNSQAEILTPLAIGVAFLLNLFTDGE